MKAEEVKIFPPKFFTQFSIVKKVIPDLGEMLVRLSIASTWSWDQVAKPFLQGNKHTPKNPLLSIFF